MSEPDALKAEDTKLRHANWDKLSRSIARAWFNEGYQPRDHLRQAVAEGDAGVLKDFYRRELDGQYGRRTIVNVMAMWDMHEMIAVGKEPDSQH